MEIMIVTALIAMVMGLAIQRIDNRNNQAKSAVRQLAGLSRDLHNKSRLNGVTYRLVIDMKEGSDSREPHSFWVEQASAAILLRPEQMSLSLAERERQERDRLGSEERSPTAGFSPDTSILKQPQVLPPPLIFEGVEVVGMEGLVNSGQAFIYFFPQGLSQEAAIHLRTGPTGRWTMATNPLTGRMDILNQHSPLSELRQGAP